MIIRLATRCPRRVPCTTFTSQVGCSRAYAHVPHSTHQSEDGEAWVVKRSPPPTPMRRDKIDWNYYPEVVDGVLTVNVKTKDDIQRVPVPGRWLRDNCACAECRNPDTAQRRINVFKNPKAGEAVSAKRDALSNGFRVTFADGHLSTIPRSLIENSKTDRTSRLRAGDRDKAEYWQADIASYAPTVEYEAVKQGMGMASLMAMIRKFGFCFVDNMPATPEATQALLEQIGPIRNTHYGGFYDFTSDLSSKDTAYTSEALEPHTDTTYFTEPIGLQALHLLSHTDGEGGLSSLVDGFGAANQLHQQHPPSYASLSKDGVYGHASGNEGVNIQPAHAFPVLNNSPDGGGLFQVRWNTADRAGLRLQIVNSMNRWYDAAARFDALLSDPKNVYWFQLKPGRMLIFDNWRVLHGRSAFTGKRRMCGGYINRDDYISRYRMTNYTKEEIDASTVTG